MILGEFVRIAKLFQEGKPLSASDRSFVARMAEKGVVQTTATPRSPATAKTTVELAKILRFSLQAVNQWKLLEGAPRPMSNGKHSVKAWCGFIGRWVAMVFGFEGWGSHAAHKARGIYAASMCEV